MKIESLKAILKEMDRGHDGEAFTVDIVMSSGAHYRDVGISDPENGSAFITQGNLPILWLDVEKIESITIHLDGGPNWADGSTESRDEVLNILDDVSASAENMLSQFCEHMNPDAYSSRRKVVETARMICNKRLRGE